MKSTRAWVYAAIRRSEKIFKTDMIYATKGSIWTTARFAIGTLTSLATIVAFGNLISRESYGTYSYLMSLASSLGFVTLTGMSTAIIRSFAKGKESVLPRAMTLQYAFNSISFLIIASVGIYYGLKGNLLFALGLGMLSIAIPLSASYHTFESILIGQKKFKKLTILTSITSVFIAFSIIGTLLITENILIVVSAFSASFLLTSYISYLYVKKSVPKLPKDEEAEKEMTKTAFHLTWAGMIGTLVQYIDKIILFQVAGPASLAVYGFAIAGPEKAKGLIKNWSSIVLPKLSERTRGEIEDTISRRIIISTTIGLVFAGLYIFSAPYLFEIFLPDYLDAVKYSQVYSLSLVIISPLIYLSNIFYGQNMIKAIYIQSTSTQVFRLVLFITLGWLWQIWGLVIASILSHLFNLVLSFFIWRKTNNGQK